MGSVVFDCDSTLSAIEGIEYISADHIDAVEALTREAMDGLTPLESVYGRRLDLIRPDRATVDRLTSAYIDTLTEDAREVVAALMAEGIRVRVLSGGLLPAVRGLAQELGLGPGDVAAVDVMFGADGSWRGYDAASPLARAGGKAEVLGGWRATMASPVMLVGDGATDAEAKDAVDVFVAYCGLVERPAVVAAADAVIRSVSLAPVLALALGAPPKDPGRLKLYEKGRSLLLADAAHEDQPEPRKQRA
jgi:phosphoserine phosphatase